MYSNSDLYWIKHRVLVLPPAAGALPVRAETHTKARISELISSDDCNVNYHHWQVTQIIAIVVTSQRLTAHPKIIENKTGWQHNSCTRIDDNQHSHLLSMLK